MVLLKIVTGGLALSVEGVLAEIIFSVQNVLVGFTNDALAGKT